MAKKMSFRPGDYSPTSVIEITVIKLCRLLYRSILLNNEKINFWLSHRFWTSFNNLYLEAATSTWVQIWTVMSTDMSAVQNAAGEDGLAKYNVKKNPLIMSAY